MEGRSNNRKIVVKDSSVSTIELNGEIYICITDMARNKNPKEPKDVIKNWMRSRTTIEYLGIWEQLNNGAFKGVEFDSLLYEAGSNSFTLSPTKWIGLTDEEINRNPFNERVAIDYFMFREF